MLWSWLVPIIIVVISAEQRASSFNSQYVLLGSPSRRHHVCSLFVYTDPYLWREVFRSSGGRDHKKTREVIKSIIDKSIKKANKVFSVSEFYGQGQTIHHGIRFNLGGFRIDDDLKCLGEEECIDASADRYSMSEMCSSHVHCGTDPFCRAVPSMRVYLHQGPSL